MSATVLTLALSAAVLHAAWNALLRSGADRLHTVTVMSAAMTVVAIPFAFVFPMPPQSAWAYLALSACLQVGYSFFLVAAYRHGDLAQVYPVVRGSVPLLVTLGGFLWAGDHIGVRAATGTVLVACGIASLALGKARARTTSVLLALASGVIIASYATVDVLGVRAAGNPGSYATWICLLYGTLLPLAICSTRGRWTMNLRAPDTGKALAGGFVSLLAYGAVIAAFSLGPAGPITALRETSVVFAALIGRLFLGEPLTARRIGSCLVVTVGAICLA